MGFFNLGVAPEKQEKKKSTATLPPPNAPDPGVVGNMLSGILFVGDYPLIEKYTINLPKPWERSASGPSFIEDPMKPLQSPRFKELWEIFRDMGMDVADAFEQFGFVNAVPNRWQGTDLSNKTASMFAPRLSQIIMQYRPKVIIPVGIMATWAVLGPRLSGRISNTKADDFFGKTIPDRYYNAWVCPTWGCPFMAGFRRKAEEDNAYRKQRIAHITAAIDLANKPFPVIPTDLRTTENPLEAAQWVSDAIREALYFDPHPDMAIDYETTGIKPHRPEQQIVAGSLAWRANGKYRAIGFKWDKDCPQLINAWHELYKPGSPVGLVAHKADFETCWTHFKAGLGGTVTDWPTNWSWDTCIGAHVLNNNQKVGLKFHTYTELGIIGYDTDADPYLSQTMPGEDSESCYSLNRLAGGNRVPWMRIGNYCGQDSLYTIMLTDIQKKQMVGKELEFFKFFLRGMVTLSKVQSGGLPIDMNLVEKAKAEVEEKRQAALTAVLHSPEAEAYKQKYATILNPNSVPDLKRLFLLTGDIKESEAEGLSTNVEFLEKLNTPLANNILEMRKYAKIGKTFIKGYAREAMWDEPTQTHLIRPFFNLSTGAGSESGGPVTYRSSSDSPNFQNIPKRDKVMKHILRSMFIAPPGYKYMEADYKSLEVMVSASYHHDPSMLKYLQDPSSDMHRDTAADMYMRRPEDVTKLERQSIKMGYVFSSFYGASYKHCAERMWAKMPDTAKDNLRAHGVATYDQFLEHVKTADSIFWNERFKVYNEWRNAEWDRYQKNGYVEGYMGCRCYGPMSFTECANRCIQGSGFHTLLQALGDDVADFERLGLKSRIIGQIHDAIVLLVKTEEQELVEDILYKNGVVKVMHNFKWIAVPLVIEAEVSEDGGCWAEMSNEHALAFSANAGTNGCFAPGEENWLEIDKHICDEVRMRQ